MAMYRLTITGEWGGHDRHLLCAAVACEFAAEHSVTALDVARTLVATLLGPDAARGGQPGLIHCRESQASAQTIPEDRPFLRRFSDDV